MDTPDHPYKKLLFDDLKRMGICGSRPHLRDLIARGTIRPPHKDGDSRQARAWWYWDDIMQDLENERQRFNNALPLR